MARYAFKCFFKVDPMAAFMVGLIDYANGRSEFSASSMLLDDIRMQATRENKRVNVKVVWEVANALNAREPFTGCGGIVQLALHLFSVIANSEDYERTFSTFGTIVTKCRVHLAPKKVHLATQVKLHLRKCHQTAGVVEYVHKKRKFGRHEPDSDTDNNATPSSMQSSSMGDAAASSQADDVKGNPSAEPGPPEEFVEEEFNDMLYNLVDQADQATWAENDGNNDDTEPALLHAYHHPNMLSFSDVPPVDLLSQSQHPVDINACRTKTNILLSCLFLFTDPLPAPGQAAPPPTAWLDLFWMGGTTVLEWDRALFECMQPHNQ